MRRWIWSCAAVAWALAQSARADEPGTLIQLSSSVLVVLGIVAVVGLVRVIRKRS
ncbi:MAG: hypothetical protein JXR37_02935 [Kiritimatiellae bacterium]|nr:hypothetical protein [Kiritimatiellia bacterium]